MSYFENRPALVDVDADVEVVAEVMVRDERGTIVQLTVTERAPASGKPLQLEVQAQHWQAFVRAVAAEVRNWENR